MKRWHVHLRDDVEDSKVDAFVSELVEVCRKHSYSLGHEDRYGAFIVEDFDPQGLGWLQSAMVDTRYSIIKETPAA